MQAYREVLCDKLKMHHQSLGTYNTAEAIEERKTVCIQLGILREQDQNWVIDVADPLQQTGESIQAGGDSGADDREEERRLFITPCAPGRGRTSASAKDDNSTSEELLRMHSTRK